MTNVYFVPPRFKGPQGQEDMPYLLTAGPVTTSRAAKIATLVDYGGEDPEFRSLVQELRRDLKRLAGAGTAHECLFLPGPALFAAEAVLTCFAPTKRKKTLVICNGRDGDRAVAVLEAMERPVSKLEKPDGVAPGVEDVAAALDGDSDITHIWIAHCDSTTGVVNPVGEIGKLARERNKTYMVDASLSFGALPLDVVGDEIDVMIGAPDTCLESLPGFSFLMVKRDLLIASGGKVNSLAFDLHGQWQDQDGKGLFRLPVPSQPLAALRQALRELESEGGIGMRRARYQRNAAEVLTRMRAMGFTPVLAETEAGPIIQAFLAPRDKKFDFPAFQEGLRQRGYLVSAGTLAKRTGFRIGCIGQVDHKVIKALALAVEEVLKEQDVQEFTPAEAAAG